MGERRFSILGLAVPRRLLYSIFTPVVTFSLGVVAQQLLQEWLSHHNAITIGLFCVVIVGACTAVLLGLQVQKHSDGLDQVKEILQEYSNQVGTVLGRMAMTSGIAVEYVADAGVGASYRKAAEIIRGARDSLTFVDLWEPFEQYQTGDLGIADETRPAREDFYAAIKEAIRSHSTDSGPFHRRVVQVPRDLLEGPIPFHVDPPFKEYLEYVSSCQRRYPLSCRVRLSPAMIRLHFILIDRRFVIMPILSHDQESQRQFRYGALFFEDGTGSLYSCLRQMYQVIESHSRPLTDRDLG
ncbi:hypothetical protein [Streptomyces sp. NBC_00557]|uniref:hypothetical protein n=1 Tax=Streptomyces sp. NBC_00557 TaxID=2975776 RepID=UPI002E8154AD|nr:hypothetical protein [Streptomyces sp. NBC_00557]WUC37401.1 hypothetical protein OG956_25900 [Streptomyces sp. NBC_00557]